MFYEAAVLDAAMSIGDAVQRLTHYPDEAFVVVHRHAGLQEYWYHYRKGEIQYFASRAERDWPAKLGTPLRDVLNLQENTASKTFELGETPAKDPSAHGVLLEGSTVVGVLRPTSVTRGGTRGGAGGSGTKLRSPNGGGGEGANGPNDGRGAPSAASAPTASRFEAFPLLEAPDGVKSGKAFELSVGLTLEKPAGPSDAEIVIDDAPAEFDLLVQLIAPGFEAPTGTLRWLHVKRADLGANQVTFELIVEEEVEEMVRRTLEVQFSFNGNPCGRAWREVTIMPQASNVTDAPHSATGSSSLTTSGSPSAPDLTVSITEADEDGRFIWLFTSPLSVKLHEQEQVKTKLKNDNARSFAVKVLKGIPQKDGTKFIDEKILGTAREVAQAMPIEFWQVLGEVWQLVHAQGRVPRLLFLSAEPYVPWELASVEEEYIDPTLLDPKRAPVLSAQVCVGRWLPPRPRTPRGGERPAQPPPVKVDVKQMAVVVGDYLAINGVRELPEAEEEGKLLSGRYRAVRLSATEDELDTLLKNQIEQDGQQVDIELLHFACHGQVDPNNPGYNGIVLNEGNLRLDATTARGTKIGAATAPFCFMNACEVGTAGETLGSYGGFAAAFLNEGFRGFIAPLWAVNDEVAHKIALEFYEKTLDEKETVSEVLRNMRAKFDTGADKPSSTYLAYVYYGHPDLVLERH